MCWPRSSASTMLCEGMLRSDDLHSPACEGHAASSGDQSVIQERGAVVELYYKTHLPGCSYIERGTSLFCILQCLSASPHAGSAYADAMARVVFLSSRR